MAEPKYKVGNYLRHKYNIIYQVLSISQDSYKLIIIKDSIPTIGNTFLYNINKLDSDQNISLGENIC